MQRQTKKHFKYHNDFAQQYSQYAEFEEIYNYFVDTFVKIHGEPQGSLVDLCCGTGDIPNKFKSIFQNLEVEGYDESAAMIDSANHSVVSFTNKPITAISKVFDNIVSNNAYHHFDNVSEFWSVIDKISHDKSKILISDVVRPETESAVSQIVKDILGENSPFEESFTLSLTSSYTEQELKAQIGSLNLVIVSTPYKNYKLFFIHN